MASLTDDVNKFYTRTRRRRLLTGQQDNVNCWEYISYISAYLEQYQLSGAFSWGGLGIPCTLRLDSPLELRNSKRGTLGIVGCPDQQSKRTRERERGQEIVITVVNSGASALREHVLACLAGFLLVYYLLCRFNATFLHQSLLPDQTFRNFPFSLSQERYLRIPEFLACSWMSQQWHHCSLLKRELDIQ